jgi:hypothetical protein
MANKLSKRHIFVARSDNDFDHAAPIIEILQNELNGSNGFILITRDPLRSYLRDYRLDYIDAKYIDSLLEFSNSFQSVVITLLRNLYWKLQKWDIPFKIFSVLKYKIGLMIYHLLQGLRNSSDSKLLRFLTQELSLSTISIDTGQDDFNKTILKERFISPSVQKIVFNHSIPHIDLSLMYGLDLDRKLTPEVDAVFDNHKIIIPNEHTYREYLRRGYNSDNLIIGGSPRFQKDWIRKIVPDSKTSSRCNEMKVLLIASKMQVHINRDEIFLILESIVKSDRFELWIKPHTRNGMSGIPNSIKSRAKIFHDDPTNDLVEKCDLIIFWSTSYIYHAIQRNKPILFLRYVYSLPFLFDHLDNIGWEVNSRNDFHTKVNKIYTLWSENKLENLDFKYENLLIEMNPESNNKIVALYGG